MSNSVKKPKIIIIGAGPCGLAAGHKLKELKHSDFLIFEQNDYVGGLSASFKDDNGFTWDLGGHITFSHFKEFDTLINEAVKNQFIEHTRTSYINFNDKWVPYPFQNNLRYLRPDIKLECLLGIFKANINKNVASTSFQEWILSTFGKGIAKHFMIPYNKKVWSVSPHRMSRDWIAERVSVINFEKVLSNVILNKDDYNWGPNNKFRFPKHGGTGEIYRKIADKIQKNIFLNHKLKKIDAKNKTIWVKNLKTNKMVSYQYDKLISTIPIDKLVLNIEGAPKNTVKSAEKLLHNSVLVVGFGFKHPLKKEKCWMYFPQKNAPFYRLTNFAKYSPNHVPEGNTKKYSSYICEISHLSAKKNNIEEIIKKSKKAIIKSGFVPKSKVNKEVSRFVKDLEYAYPIPTIDRDKNLKIIQKYLMSKDIFSRGRFGGWKYEIGNMDHAVKMGFEIVERLLRNKKEKVWEL